MCDFGRDTPPDRTNLTPNRLVKKLLQGGGGSNRSFGGRGGQRGPSSTGDSSNGIDSPGPSTNPPVAVAGGGNATTDDSSSSSSSSASSGSSSSTNDQEPVGQATSNLWWLTDVEKILTLDYSDPDGDEASECQVQSLSNLVESTACSCLAGICTVGLTSTPGYSGMASFEFSVVTNSLESEFVANSVELILAGGPFPGTFEDPLNALNYSFSAGSLNWSSDWIESGEADGAMAGIVQINNKAGPGPVECSSGNCLRIGDNSLSVTGTYSLERKMNLIGASTASLGFDWRRDSAFGYLSASDFQVEISKDNGVTWTTIFIVLSGGSDGSMTTESIDISN
ncbi:MAG: hypothetical protein H6624_12710 [Bdellovibrionaceae bacterium]|nr:hypothetical protein [Bdellovibrionales bacterium]MCB9085206.1 hypothetical protein [Pseudobdellovibrionaceae bacterium]